MYVLCYHRYMTSIRLDTQVFIDRSTVIHGNKYDYSESVYTRRKDKIIIICKQHGKFEQTPNDHLAGKGCKKCRDTYLSNRFRSNTEDFVSKARKVHGNKYDYSEVFYQMNQVKVTIICPEHGRFEQKPVIHLLGCGCDKCSNELVAKKLKSNTKDFVSKANIVHNNRYDYSKSVYLGSHTKITIVCLKHGEFIQTPSSHLGSCGCPKCSTSRGEIAIENYLEEHKYQYVTQYTFGDCKGTKKLLPFDFFVTLKNGRSILLELDGDQHREARFGQESLERIQKNDTIKSLYCLKKNLVLHRIQYDTIHLTIKDQIPNIISQLEVILDTYEAS